MSDFANANQPLNPSHHRSNDSFSKQKNTATQSGARWLHAAAALACLLLGIGIAASTSLPWLNAGNLVTQGQRLSTAPTMSAAPIQWTALNLLNVEKVSSGKAAACNALNRLRNATRYVIARTTAPRTPSRRTRSSETAFSSLIMLAGGWVTFMAFNALVKLLWEDRAKKLAGMLGGFVGMLIQNLSVRAMFGIMGFGAVGLLALASHFYVTMLPDALQAMSSVLNLPTLAGMLGSGVIAAVVAALVVLTLCSYVMLDKQPEIA